MQPLIQRALGFLFGDGSSDPFQWSAVAIVILDIALVYLLIYRGLLLIKGTKAVRMLLGLLLLIVGYFASRYFGLRTLTWMLDQFFGSFILLVLILFQDEIRRGLSRVGINPFTSSSQFVRGSAAALEEIVRAVQQLAAKRIGALIVLEREADVTDYIQEGVALDAKVSKEMLFSVFLPYSPMHDGAVIIQKGLLARAGCFLPLSDNPKLSRELGTRHRAAIGLSERTDALVVVVSETDGGISTCLDGEITRGLDQSGLYNVLLELFLPRSKRTSKSATPEAG